MTEAEILAEAKALAPWLVRIRRHLHRNPELGRREFETAAYIESELSELGLEVRRLGTAVIGYLRGDKGPTVALRADIDALPVEERNDLEFRSQRPGLMHACGHDAHTSIALGVAKLFASRRAVVPGNLLFLFQPDEEGEGGAEILVKAGFLDEPRVDAVLGLHVMPYLDSGQVEVKKGAMNGSSTTLSIMIRGRGAHGAYPETGIDAILIAATVVQSLNQLVSRYVSPLEQAVLTIGTINGGARSNIVAEEVAMEATLRTTSDAIRDLLIERARAMVDGIASGFGGSGSVEARFGYAALVNHDREVDLVAGVAARMLGPDSVHWKEKPSMGVEDFSFYVMERPGAFWHLGCGAGPREGRASLHSGGFFLDEDCLPIGVAIQAATALAIMRERNNH